MTINKAQGQTLRMAGLYLPIHLFSHGELYVAKTRVGAKCALRMVVKCGKARLRRSMSRTFTRSCCCGDACEETEMHVKSHDQVFNALEPLPCSLFFSVEIHYILQSLYDNCHQSILSTDL